MLYKNRAEISSIVHCHSDWASTLSCLRKIFSISLHGSRVWGKDIKCAKYATFGTKKLLKMLLKH